MASRFLYLVRHGHYFTDEQAENYGSLTELGHKQMQGLSERLKDYPIVNLHCSTMQRAQESAMIVIEDRPGLAFKSYNILREGMPWVSQKVIKEQKMDRGALKVTRDRMEHAYRKFFVKNSNTEDIHEALICHGNIIRFFICKSLNIPVSVWSGFEVFEGSLTIIEIKDNGRMVVKSVGESGHMPIEERTIL